MFNFSLAKKANFPVGIYPVLIFQKEITIWNNKKTRIAVLQKSKIMKE